jgi:hypothetical protein
LIFLSTKTEKTETGSPTFAIMVQTSFI